MKTINELLQITKSEYEDLKMQYWVNYCSQKATSIFEWQVLLTEQSINKWFNVEFDKLEQEFRESITRFDESPTITKADRMKCYKMAVCRIYGIWLQPKIEDVQKMGKTIQNPMYNYN